jgi:hypothetical protein
LGAVRAVGAHGDLLPAIVWGALWGALAGALVTVVVALACRNPAGEPARSPDGGPMADAGPVPATPAGTAAAGGQVGTHGREHEHRRH